MIVVKYQAGALGNFLCSVLHEEIKPLAKLDYGNPHKILHTGGYDCPDDSRFKKDIRRITTRLVSHNNPKFENWLNDIKDSKNIFIDLKSNFVEYRLNYIYKMPDRNLGLNQYAIKHSWKDFSHPIACDDARRIFRLNQNDEQMIKVNKTRDVIFDFGNFYITDEEIWLSKFKKLTEQVAVEITNDELSSWFRYFQQGQAEILERAKVLYECIQARKFVPGLTENEKGIIVGYHAVADENNKAEYFINAYDTLTKSL